MVKLLEDKLASEGIEGKVSMAGSALKHLQERWSGALERGYNFFEKFRKEKTLSGYKGFSLTELMVTIAAVALLMGISIPVLQRAKEKAKASYCLSNARNLTVGWLAFKDDNDDKIINGYPGVGEAPWVQARSANMSAIEAEKEGISRGFLYPYVGNEAEVYRCPADRRLLLGTAFRSYSIAEGMNAAIKDRGEIVPYTRYGQIRRPVEKDVFVETADPRGWNSESWLLHPKSGEWVDPVAVWHNSTALGYADGHIVEKKWKGKGFKKWCEAACNNPSTFQFNRNPSNELEDFEFMRRGYAYQALK